MSWAFIHEGGCVHEGGRIHEGGLTHRHNYIKVDSGIRVALHTCTTQPLLLYLKCVV